MISTLTAGEWGLAGLCLFAVLFQPLQALWRVLCRRLKHQTWLYWTERNTLTTKPPMARYLQIFKNRMSQISRSMGQFNHSSTAAHIALSLASAAEADRILSIQRWGREGERLAVSESVALMDWQNDKIFEDVR